MPIFAAYEDRKNGFLEIAGRNRTEILLPKKHGSPGYAADKSSR
jgi:hypothetical protein